MNSYSKRSLDKLLTCHLDLLVVFQQVLKDFDHSILCGHRNEEDQNDAFAQGSSQLKWPNGKHNELPSLAVDAIPYPIDWTDRERMTYFAGQVIATGRAMGIEIRWGGNWAMDTHLSNNKFDDLVHFELIL